MCRSCDRTLGGDERFCPACGTPLELDPSTVSRRTVTIVFCDVVGSTALGEQLDPEALRDVMNRHHARLDEIVRRHDGTVEKFIGDAVLAVFGIPRLREDDALRAVRAADEMRAPGGDLVVRVGVATGEVVTGAGQTLGSGDAFNLAARLEQAADPGTVLISGTTLALVRDAVEVDPLPPLTLKGKDQPVDAFRVERVTGDVGAKRRSDAAIVGRDRERRFLREAFDRAVDERTCHLVTLLGEPGIGKSRLLRDALESLDGEATILFTRCQPQGESAALAPVAEILRSAGTTIDLVGRELAETFVAVRDRLESIARARPTLVVFDDVHWAEPAVLDLIDHVAEWSDGVPLVVLCAARPELLDNRPMWGGGKSNAASLRLTPLDPAESAVLIDDLLGSAVPSNIRERLVAASEGNPLFAEQLVAMHDDGSDDVPPTIAALLAARLDGLSREERELLEVASIEGREFQRAGVEHLLAESGEPDVQALLHDLVRKRFVQTLRSGEFRFHHDLVRDAALRAIPKRRRADLHIAFADWVERDDPGAVDVIGHHLAEAARNRREVGIDDTATKVTAERAAAALAQSGARALEIGDAQAACSSLERAAGLAAEPGPVLLTDLGIALRAARGFDEAASALARAQVVARERGDDTAYWRARVEWLAVSDATGELSKADALQEVIEATDVLSRTGDDLGLSRALQHLGWLVEDGYLEIDRRALEHARAAGARREEAEILVDMEWHRSSSPTPIDDCLAGVASLLGQPNLSRRAESGLLACLGTLQYYDGDSEAARDTLARAARAYRELGRSYGISSVLHTQANVERYAGNLEAAERLLRESLAIADRIGDRVGQGERLLALAEIASQRLDYAASLRLSDQAARHPVDEEDLLVARSRALIGVGELDAALEMARRACEITRVRYVRWVGLAAAAHGRALQAVGRTPEAIDELERALEIFEQKGIEIDAAGTRALLAGIREGRIGTGPGVASA